MTKVNIFPILFFSVLLFYTSLTYFTSNLDALIKFESQKAPPIIRHHKCDRDIAPFYIYELPDRFNEKLLSNCSTLDPYFNKCPYMENHGLGEPLYGPDPSNLSSRKTNLGWYNTYQTNADVIFHARAINHPCRTYNHSEALMFYVPFYPSLYAPSYFHEFNLTRRDAMAVDLAGYIAKFPTFKHHGGRDHFLVSGIVVQDLIRRPQITDAVNYRANKLLDLPELKNVSVLIIERKHPHKYKNHIGIPYPSYFHPRTKSEVTSWQDDVRQAERTFLFSYVGGTRPKGHVSEMHRTAVIDQCEKSERCLLFFCKYWVSVWDVADEIIGAMKKSNFCLQPPGDTNTRRSVFDSILSGCIPVFFTDLTAYSQYEWYVPENREDWSVFIRPEQLFRIENVLARIPEREIRRMRETVIRMIPQVTYAHPNATEIGFRDAVDTALVELTKRIQRIKRDVEDGGNRATSL